jgi:hypothetical protein
MHPSYVSVPTGPLNFRPQLNRPFSDFIAAANGGSPYPHATSDHGANYNNVYWGNRVPLTYRNYIPNVTNRFALWQAQAAYNQIPYSLAAGSPQYPSARAGISQSAQTYNLLSAAKRFLGIGG